MSNNQNKHGRNFKSLILDPFKQFKFGLYFISLSVIFIAGCSFLFVSSFMQQYAQLMEVFKVVDPSMKWEIVMNDVFQTNALKIGILFLVYILAVFVLSFKLTHRYYGPLVSIERFVKSITSGNYESRCTIRNKDELLDLVKDLNHMAETLEKRHKDNSNSKIDKSA